MIAVYDPVDIRAYNALANRLLIDAVNSLKRLPAKLTRASNTILNRTVETPIEKLWWARCCIHESCVQLNNDIRFIESAAFESLCTALDIDAARAYAALKRKYARKCRQALSLAEEAKKTYINFLENK